MRIFYGSVDSRHLETLLWVVRLGGISAAAHHLNLTQPAVTRRIQELERELGAKVLRRQGRTVVPTALGQSCLVAAERILSEVEMMKVAAGGDAAVGTIRVGLVESIALTWFQSFLTRIEQRYPRVQLEIDVDLSSRLVSKLARHQVDVALVPGPVDVAGTMCLPLGSCALRWLGHPHFRSHDPPVDDPENDACPPHRPPRQPAQPACGPPGEQGGRRPALAGRIAEPLPMRIECAHFGPLPETGAGKAATPDTRC